MRGGNEPTAVEEERDNLSRPAGHRIYDPAVRVASRTQRYGVGVFAAPKLRDSLQVRHLGSLTQASDTSWVALEDVASNGS